MERRALVSITLLTGSQSPEQLSVSPTQPTHLNRPIPEVLSSLYIHAYQSVVFTQGKKTRCSSTHLGNRLAIQSKHHPTHWLISMLQIKVDLPHIVSKQTATSHCPNSSKLKHTLLVTLGPRGALSSACTRASANAKTTNNETKMFLNRMIAFL